MGLGGVQAHKSKDAVTVGMWPVSKAWLLAHFHASFAPTDSRPHSEQTASTSKQDLSVLFIPYSPFL